MHRAGIAAPVAGIEHDHALGGRACLRSPVAPPGSATARERRRLPERRSPELAAVNAAASAPVRRRRAGSAGGVAAPGVPEVAGVALRCGCRRGAARGARALAVHCRTRQRRAWRPMFETRRSRGRSPPMPGRCRHAARTSRRRAVSDVHASMRRRAAASTSGTWRLRRLSPKRGRGPWRALRAGRPCRRRSV